MENASKALIIAGAILVAILLIGVGVLIINSTGKVTDQVGTTSDTYAIQSFNAQFTPYEGTKVTASQVKTLSSLVKSSNGTSGRTITINSIVTAANETYKVTLTYGTDGYVSAITIAKNT